jgi:hypothetical protein
MQIDTPPKLEDETPFQRFEKIAKRVVAVPKQEVTEQDEKHNLKEQRN